MARQHFFQADDPADADGEAQLGVYFTIEHPGQDPHGYGEHFDPGCGAEFTIVSVQDDIGQPVNLTDAQLEVVEAEIREHFDFRAARRDERQRDDL